MPKANGPFLLWLQTFLSKLATLGGLLGLTATEITDINTAGIDTRDLRITADNKEAEAKAANAAYKGKRKILNDLIRPAAQRMKTMPTYNLDLGNQLGIEGPDHDPDLENAKPSGKVTLQSPGHIKIDFVQGDAQGVHIFSQRGSDSTFIFLATDTHTPYIDTRPNLAAGQPEIRNYKMVYIDNDEEIGHESDVISITV
jgi:hypothetical protein